MALLITLGSEAEMASHNLPSRTPDPQNEPKGPTDEAAAGRVAVLALGANLIMTSAKKSLSSYVQNYGAATGDYLKQAEMSSAMQMASEALGLGIGILGGVATGNYALAATTAVSYGVEKINSAISYSTNQRNAKLAAGYTIGRLGILTDGSRN